MSRFEDVHAAKVTGSLAMFDRMIFRGHLMGLDHSGGVQALLWKLGVPLTGFAEWASEATAALCRHAQDSAEQAGRPYIYLERNTTRDSGQTKEDVL